MWGQLLSAGRGLRVPRVGGAQAKSAARAPQAEFENTGLSGATGAETGQDTSLGDVPRPEGDLCWLQLGAEEGP